MHKSIYNGRWSVHRISIRTKHEVCHFYGIDGRWLLVSSIKKHDHISYIVDSAVYCDGVVRLRV